MRNITFLGACCLMVVAAESRTSSLQGNQAPKSVEVQYRLLENSVTLHEPVVVLFSVHNGLSEPITLTLGSQSRQFFRFSLTTPDGKVPESAPFPDVDVVTFDGQGKAVVQPGADYRQPLLMNQWFPFKSPGTYLLTSQLTTGIDLSGTGSLPPQSQTIRLRITARDPARLRKICGELARQFANTLSVEEWQKPALALSYVEDPIAVPFLAQVLSSHKGGESFAIPGLERIGNDDATEVLLAALDDKTSDIADLARRALGRMQSRISNPRLKETVSRALAPKRGN